MNYLSFGLMLAAITSDSRLKEIIKHEKNMEEPKIIV